MEKHENKPSQRRTINSALLTFFLLSVALAFATKVSAQRRTIPSIERRRAAMERSIMLDHIRDATERPFKKDKELEKRQQTAALAQIREDYVGIQNLNNEMMRLAVMPEPDYKKIAETAGEMEKRAARLKTYLALPKYEESEKEQKEQVNYDLQLVRKTVKDLDQKILRFVDSSFFKNPGVNDTEEWERASRDLAGIISLSRNLKKNVIVLDKRP